MDLAVWIRNRRFRGLLELIMQLPEASRFNEARLNDPEFAMPIALAEREAERKGKQSKWRPRLSEWDIHAQLLRDIREATIRAGDFAFMAAVRKKPKYVESIPGPETAIERIKQELSHQGQMEIIAIFAPHALTRGE